MNLAIFILALAQATETPPANQQLAISYVRAMECSSRFAVSASLNDKTARTIPGAALDECSKEKEDATRSLPRTDLDPTGKVADWYIEGQMRISAANEVIRRIESNQLSLTNPPNDGVDLVGPAVRYGLCIRVTIDREVAKTFLGGRWFTDTVSRPKPEAEVVLIEEGRKSCAASKNAYSAEYEAAAKRVHRDLRTLVKERYNPARIEADFVGEYLR